MTIVAMMMMIVVVVVVVVMMMMMTITAISELHVSWSFKRYVE